LLPVKLFPEQTLEIQGISFIIWNGAPPIVTLGSTQLQITGFSGCSRLDVRGENATACTTIYAKLPQFGGPSQNLQIENLTVSWPEIQPPHPAARTQGVPCTVTRPFIIAPLPSLFDIRPPVLCNQSTLQDVYLEGVNFLIVYDTSNYNAPSVSVNNQPLTQTNVNYQNCTTISLPGENVEICTTVVASIDTSTLSEQRNTITVTNPTFSQCQGATATEFLILPPPSVSGVSPVLICASNASSNITLQGTGFIAYDNYNPVVSINDETATVTSTTSCTSTFTVAQHTVRTCSQIQVTIPSQLPYLQSVGPFVPLITVTPPFLPTCIAKTNALTVAPAPFVTQVIPQALCIYQTTTQSIILVGNGFLFSLDKPQVYINGVFAPIIDQTNCSVVTVNDEVLGFCLEVNVTLVPSLFGLGNLDIVVTNPSPYPCSANTSGLVPVVNAPTVTGVSPQTLCSGNTSITVTVTGSGFDQNSEVILIRDCVARPPSCDRTFVGTVTSVTPTQIVATFGSSLNMPPDYYFLEVSTYGLCAQPNSSIQLAIAPPLLILFASPSVIYNAFPMQVVLFCTGLVAPPAQVILYNNVTSLQLTMLNGGGTDPNIVYVLIPANLTAGDWYITIVTSEGCSTSIVNPLIITDQLTINLELIDPAYVWTAVATDVTITAYPTGAAFVPYPSVYISPHNSVNSTIIQLSAVDILSSYSLASSIPPNMALGTYDLIVVNPTGDVGFLANALTVTPNPPPQIDDVIPLYYTFNKVGSGTIIGSGFSVTNVTVQVNCLLSSGSYSYIPASGTPLSSTQVAATFDFTGVSSGAYCVVILTNSDGQYSMFSAITTKSTSGNLVGWVPTAPTFLNMQVPRRGHALIVGKATNTNQFIYALGGDNGNKDQNTQTLERAPIDIFGTIGNFQLVPYNYLPQGRTFTAAITLGRFIYVIGGYWNVDGITALSSSIRAEILNPKDIPFVTATILLVDSGTSQFTEGYWLYAVSAIYGPNDPTNPRGESLRSDILSLYLPSTANKLQVQLSWTPLPRAVGYRIYRTGAPNMNATALYLLVEIDSPTTIYIDTGGPVDGVTTPLSIGTLGKWQDIPGLNTPREGLALAVGQDPIQTDLWYLYALFGRDGNGVYLNTYEILTINTSTPEQMWTGGWQQQVAYVNNFGPAIERADCGAVSATSRDTGTIPVNQTWIFIPGGATTGGGALTQNLLAAEVLPGGNLSFNVLICGNSPCSTNSLGLGYCTIQATGIIYFMGGYGNSLTATNGGSSNVIGTPPALQQSSFNSLGSGGLMSVNRAYAACTYQSSKLFISGGYSGSIPGPVTASVQSSIQ
jgi:hypothetical protein